MRISRLRLRNIRRHRDLSLDLAPGLTVIRGPNESGKTTVQRGLELGLFRRCTATGQDVEAVRSWGSGPEDVPSVELDFETDGTSGHLLKSFGGARGRAELALGEERLTDPAAVDARLAELIGIPSERFFRSTASVRHQELDELEADEGVLRDRLQESISGAGPGTHVARRKLEAAIARHRSEGPRNPGLVKAARDEVALLEQEVREGETRLVRQERDREALSVARERLAEIEAQLEADTEQLVASERAVELLERARDAQARYERYRRAAELRDLILERESRHPSRTALPVLRTSVEQLRDLERRISELRAGLAEEPDVSGYDVAPGPSRWRPWFVAAVLLAMAAAVVALVGTSLGLGPLAPLASFALVLMALIALLGAVRARGRAADWRRREVLREQGIARRLRGRSELEQELRETERGRDERLAALGLPDLPAAEALLAAETEHVAGIDQLKAEYRGLVGEAELPDDVANLRDRAAAEADQARHALAGMGEIGRDPHASRERFAAAVASARANRERGLSEEAAARARVEANDVDAEAVAGLSERLADARERLAAHERRLRILQATLEVLDEAEQATIKKAARFLERRMARDVATITDGRYARVQVDENELRFRVWSPDRGDWVDVAELSQGTLDQFYLAARLGLVEQVTRDRRPPLVFDDPFVSFDDERARRALELLKQTAGDHQVIYLTCSDRYDAVADRLVTLPAPPERDTEQPPGPAPAR